MLNQIIINGTFEQNCQSPSISMHRAGENLDRFKLLTRKCDFPFHTVFT